MKIQFTPRIFNLSKFWNFLKLLKIQFRIFSSWIFRTFVKVIKSCLNKYKILAVKHSKVQPTRIKTGMHEYRGPTIRSGINGPENFKDLLVLVWFGPRYLILIGWFLSKILKNLLVLIWSGLRFFGSGPVENFQKFVGPGLNWSKFSFFLFWFHDRISSPKFSKFYFPIRCQIRILGFSAELMDSLIF